MSPRSFLLQKVLFFFFYPIEDVCRLTGEVLQRIGVFNPTFERRVLLEEMAGLKGGGFLSLGVQRLVLRKRWRLFWGLWRRARHEPLSYIVGNQPFWKDTFLVGAGVLIPRPDTETLLEALQAQKESLQKHSPLRILDLGTGSGCLLLSALGMFEGSVGMGVDKSPKALAYSRKNAHRIIGSENKRRVCFVQKDWRALFSYLTQEGNIGKYGDFGPPFDVILSNPPYINPTHRNGLDKEVRDFEPSLALFANQEGLAAYKEIATCATALAHKETRLIVEVGQHQAMPVKKIFAQNGWIVYNSQRDLAGITRCLVACPEL